MPEEMPEGAQIQGKGVSSILEWRVALALDKFGWEYIYQLGVAGGRSLRGGQVIDFLVLTIPLPTPLYVHGEYWHGGKQSAKDALERIMFSAYMHGRMQLPVILWGAQLQTQEMADQAILKLFGRAQ
jgi:hypothetical protein